MRQASDAGNVNVGLGYFIVFAALFLYVQQILSL